MRFVFVLALGFLLAYPVIGTAGRRSQASSREDRWLRDATHTRDRYWETLHALERGECGTQMKLQTSSSTGSVGSSYTASVATLLSHAGDYLGYQFQFGGVRGHGISTEVTDESEVASGKPAAIMKLSASTQDDFARILDVVRREARSAGIEILNPNDWTSPAYQLLNKFIAVEIKLN